MKKDALYIIPSVLIGCGIGYALGTLAGVSGWELFYEILSGALLFYCFAFALLEKHYDIFAGVLIGLIIVLSLDCLI